MKILRPNRDGLYFAIATYITFQSAKIVLLNKLNTIQSIGSFLRTKRGYKVTNPEGYVAIKKGVKLVDRLEFSRANFTMAKDWVKISMYSFKKFMMNAQKQKRCFRYIIDLIRHYKFVC